MGHKMYLMGMIKGVNTPLSITPPPKLRIVCTYTLFCSKQHLLFGCTFYINTGLTHMDTPMYYLHITVAIISLFIIIPLTVKDILKLLLFVCCEKKYHHVAPEIKQVFTF